MIEKRVLTPEQTAEKELAEFLESELGDYSFTWTINRNPDYDTDNEIHFEVDYVNPSDETHSLHFYYDSVKQELFVQMYEDHYEMIRKYDWQVKYFWMQVKW